MDVFVLDFVFVYVCMFVCVYVCRCLCIPSTRRKKSETRTGVLFQYLQT